MNSSADAARWDRLIRLLRPIHEQAVATARRLSRSIQDGDDLYHEAVLRAYNKLNSLRDESRFRSWFFATLLSRHRSRVRRPGREWLPIEDTLGRWDEPIGEDGALWEDKRLRSNRAARALAGLDPVQREAIVMHDVEGFSVEEVADMQRVTRSAVKSRLARGRDKLRRFYLRCARESEEPRVEGPSVGAMAWPAKERSHE
jgi:RNA polymerase sigma-70 factor (ECF subfamily)